MEQKEFYRTLVQRYLSKQLTDKELDIFVQLTKEGKLDEELTIAMNAEAGISETDDINASKFKSIKLWPRIAAAASIAVALSAGIWFYSNKYQVANVNDIEPGGNRATLTLNNGKTIQLSNAKTGLVIGENNLSYSDGTAIKTETGATATNGRLAADNLRLTTVSTPRGGTYQVHLPDGTKIWLNAASSLTYSVTPNETGVRRVKLSGEAYFEVAKDKARPFLVQSKTQEVEVLGTHFNINTYDDEPIVKTTLLEGSVRIIPSETELNTGLTLKPNQQAILVGGKLMVQAVDATESISWKNGKFTFDREEISSIMRKVARWYNVQVVYQGNLNGIKLTGSVSRFENVSKLLEVLENTQEVHFKIEAHKITVMQ
jgi:transmembrane sensor